MKKRIAAVLLSLVVAVAMMPLVSSAEDITIDSVKVNYTLPKVGAKITLPTIPEDANYEIDDVYIWEDQYDTKAENKYYESDLQTPKYYKSGYTYGYDIFLVPKDGYRFDSSIDEEDMDEFHAYVDAAYVDPWWCEIDSDEIEIDSLFLGNCLKAKVPKSTYVYTGKYIKPAVTVKGLTGYFLPAYKNNKSVGTATVITKENFGNSTAFAFMPKTTFKIVPKTPTIKSTTAGSRKLTVKMSTKISSTGGTYYKIAYKAKGTSKWKFTSTKSQTKTITGLKKGKQYYVKVYAYKGSYKGSWSKTKLTNAIK